MSEPTTNGRHCRTRPMGEPCDNHVQCLSGHCDTANDWGCRDLCVSELDANGHNRHCDPKQIGETCAHHENCEDGACDLDGVAEEYERCQHKCIKSGLQSGLSSGCPKSHCSPDCPLCLGDLLSLPNGSQMSEWSGYPSHRWQKNEVNEIRVWMNAAEETQLRLRIPASCIQEQPCVEITGSLMITKLHGAKVRLQSGLFAGFPATKPSIDVLANGACPTRSDGFPVAGNTGCCYAPDSVPSCSSTPYGKDCESFHAGAMVYGENDGWNFENREDDSVDSFDEVRTRVPFPNQTAPLDQASPKDFKIQLDFANEQYEYFGFGSQWFNMNNAALMKFNRDRDCNHVHDWPQAAFEFVLGLIPPTGSGVTHDAEVTLRHLEVSKRGSCPL